MHLSDVLDDTKRVDKDSRNCFEYDCPLVDNAAVDEVISKGEGQVSKWLPEAYPDFGPPMVLKLYAKNGRENRANQHERWIQSFIEMKAW